MQKDLKDNIQFHNLEKDDVIKENEEEEKEQKNENNEKKVKDIKNFKTIKNNLYNEVNNTFNILEDNLNKNIFDYDNIKANNELNNLIIKKDNLYKNIKFKINNKINDKIKNKKFKNHFKNYLNNKVNSFINDFNQKRNLIENTNWKKIKKFPLTKFNFINKYGKKINYKIKPRLWSPKDYTDFYDYSNLSINDIYNTINYNDNLYKNYLDFNLDYIKENNLNLYNDLKELDN